MIEQVAVAVAVAVMAGVYFVPARVSAQPTLTDGQVLALFDEANTADIWTARVRPCLSRARARVSSHRD